MELRRGWKQVGVGLSSSSLSLLLFSVFVVGCSPSAPSLIGGRHSEISDGVEDNSGEFRHVDASAEWTQELVGKDTTGNTDGGDLHELPLAEVQVPPSKYTFTLIQELSTADMGGVLGDLPESLIMLPSGDRLFATYRFPGDGWPYLVTFERDEQDGTLAVAQVVGDGVSQLPWDSWMYEATLHPSGQYLLMRTKGNCPTEGCMTVLALENKGESLIKVPQVFTPGLEMPYFSAGRLTVSPDGQHTYMGNSSTGGDEEVLSFGFSAVDGSLTCQWPPYMVTSYPYAPVLALGFDTSGTRLFVYTGDHLFFVFNRDTESGELSCQKMIEAGAVNESHWATIRAHPASPGEVLFSAPSDPLLVYSLGSPSDSDGCKADEVVELVQTISVSDAYDAVGGGPAFDMQISPDGLSLVFQMKRSAKYGFKTEEGGVLAWAGRNEESGEWELQSSLELPAYCFNLDSIQSIRTMAFSPDSDFLYVGGQHCWHKNLDDPVLFVYKRSAVEE
jgi:hypothetical protein